MPKAVIAGYYGSDNAGDEAMLAAISSDLKRRVADLDIVVISTNPQRTAERHGLSAVSRLDLFGIVRQLAGADLFISGGGSLIQDVTSRRNLWYQLALIALARLLSRRTMIYGQGIGPIRSRWGRRAAALVLNRVHAITVREAQSQEALLSSGVRPELIKLAADPAFLYPHQPDRDSGRRILEGCRVPPGPAIGLFPRPWSGEDLCVRLAAAADEIARLTGASIVLLPMQSHTDGDCCQRIRELMRTHAAVVDCAGDPRGILDIVSCLDLVIGLRLHSLVFAAVAGVVPVGIAYDPKVQAFCRELDFPCGGSWPGLCQDELLAVVRQSWSDRAQLRERLRTRTEQLRRRADTSGEVAAHLIAGGGVP